MATQAELDAAKSALHALLTGEQVEETEVDGRRTRYMRMSPTALKKHIAQLQAELDPSTPRRGAITFLG